MDMNSNRIPPTDAWPARTDDLANARSRVRLIAEQANKVEDERFALRCFLRELADSLNPTGYEIAIAAHCTDPYKVAMSVRAGDCGSDVICQRVFRLLEKLKAYRTAAPATPRTEQPALCEPAKTT